MTFAESEAVRLSLAMGEVANGGHGNAYPCHYHAVCRRSALAMGEVVQAGRRFFYARVPVTPRPSLRGERRVPCPRLCVGMLALHAHAKPWAWHPNPALRSNTHVAAKQSLREAL